MGQLELPPIFPIIVFAESLKCTGRMKSKLTWNSDVAILVTVLHHHLPFRPFKLAHLTYHITVLLLLCPALPESYLLIKAVGMNHMSRHHHTHFEQKFVEKQKWYLRQQISKHICKINCQIKIVLKAYCTTDHLPTTNNYSHAKDWSLTTGSMANCQICFHRNSAYVKTYS